jgi:CubicO group peptidase (beta-lactamase class C family)
MLCFILPPGNAVAKSVPRPTTQIQGDPESKSQPEHDRTRDGGCCLAMTLRDFGRFGQFILDGTRVNGKPVVPEDWLTDATRTQVSTGAESGYGYQWWTRQDGTFEGRGIYGQTLHIDRTRRLVIVINSATEQPTGRVSGEARRSLSLRSTPRSTPSGDPNSVPPRITVPLPYSLLRAHN